MRLIRFDLKSGKEEGISYPNVIVQHGMVSYPNVIVQQDADFRNEKMGYFIYIPGRSILQPFPHLSQQHKTKKNDNLQFLLHI